ncbi:MAG: carbohydrate-binding family 9-like protein [Candidatus Eisenbacteria bacterium]|uniref:Carbohydrate-binding family 9-like protein n=1 Tax=Eiseniibacteriota bacterium TaxID=2212470 RepID=A0A956LW56_UNCEI|nr:carbohydrate-binding family 9-like protein [Candidatus Eisenbacteria bacterium]
MVHEDTPDREVRRYLCRRVERVPSLDGQLVDPVWSALPWSEPFVDITGDDARAPRYRTRMKMGWDDRHLYVGGDLEEPHVWGTLTEKNSRLYEDNDFELFVDPDGDGRDYYEFEINALGTIWELSLPRPYREGGIAESGCNIPGLVSAVHVRGTVNDPSDLDDGWSVTIAIPWEGLARYNPGRATPPRTGDVWKVNFSRVQWRHEVRVGRYVRVPPHGMVRPAGLHADEYEHPEDNWVWSPQGVVNMHIPARWGEVVFG